MPIDKEDPILRKLEELDEKYDALKKNSDQQSRPTKQDYRMRALTAFGAFLPGIGTLPLGRIAAMAFFSGTSVG